MVDEEEKTENTEDGAGSKKKTTLFVVVGAVVGVILVAVIAGSLMSKPKESAHPIETTAEYVVPDRLYQLKDGSYLRLSFSIVVSAKQLNAVKEVIEKEGPARLPDGINMVVGNKTRDDLIQGTHNREAFTRELKKVLEERVFADYNRKQTSAKDAIEIKEILLSNFVTQPG